MTNKNQPSSPSSSHTDNKPPIARGASNSTAHRRARYRATTQQAHSQFLTSSPFFNTAPSTLPRSRPAHKTRTSTLEIVEAALAVLGDVDYVNDDGNNEDDLLSSDPRCGA